MRISYIALSQHLFGCSILQLASFHPQRIFTKLGRVSFPRMILLSTLFWCLDTIGCLSGDPSELGPDIFDSLPSSLTLLPLSVRLSQKFSQIILSLSFINKSFYPQNQKGYPSGSLSTHRTISAIHLDVLVLITRIITMIRFVKTKLITVIRDVQCVYTKLTSSIIFFFIRITCHDYQMNTLTPLFIMCISKTLPSMTINQGTK